MFIKQQSCTVLHIWFQKYFDHCADNTELTLFQYHLFPLNSYGLYFMHSKSILPKRELRWRSPALSHEKRQSWFREEAGLEGYTGNDPAASHLRRPSCPRAETDAHTGNCPVDPHQADDFIHDIGSLDKDTWDSEKVLIIQSFHLRHCYQVTPGGAKTSLCRISGPQRPSESRKACFCSWLFFFPPLQ